MFFKHVKVIKLKLEIILINTIIFLLIFLFEPIIHREKLMEIGYLSSQIYYKEDRIFDIIENGTVDEAIEVLEFLKQQSIEILKILFRR